MKSINLTGIGLATLVSEELERDVQKVRVELDSTLLPLAIGAIWAKSPELENLRSKYGKEIDLPLSMALTHNVITFPGTTGLKRVYADLIASGIDSSLANTTAQTIGNYTRFPLSILNLSRHLKTACNFAIKSLTIAESDSSNVIANQILKTSKELANRSIKNEEDLVSWLTDLQDLMCNYIDSEKERKLSHINNFHVNKARENANANLAATYARRFARYIGISLNLKNIEGFYDSEYDSTLEKELQRIGSFYDSNSNALFNTLKREYDSKAARITSTKSVNVDEISDAPLANLTVHELQIDNRKLRLEFQKYEDFEILIAEFKKLLTLQFDLGDLGPLLEMKAQKGNSLISLRFESPTTGDKEKILKVVTSLSSL